MPNHLGEFISEAARVQDAIAQGIHFKECTPKILVVTDGALDYNAGNGFGLTQFVSTLTNMTIHGMKPIVVLASRGAASGAALPNFKFDDANKGIKKSRYDMVFLFGFNGEGSPLAAGEVDAVARFMQAGGGVFATGDHEDLGAGMSMNVPRVRSMRAWRLAETPNGHTATRLTTNLPGDDGVFEFTDQSDRHAQRLYANWRTVAGGIGRPHPLVQTSVLWPLFGHRALDVFPDHPHEGECRIPRDLTTTFVLDGAPVDEWPHAAGGGARVSPEIAARTMSFGNGFAQPSKEPVVPRAFIAIAGYDGHRAGVGRVVTDATWHHFVNINLDGTGAGGGLTGLQNPLGTDTPELTKIRRYYRNIATWLMPTTTRRCLVFPWIVNALTKYPLAEELRPVAIRDASGADLHAMGTQLIAALGVDQPPFFVEDLLRDALEDAVGEEQAGRLLAHGTRFGEVSGREFATAAFGAQVAAAVDLVVASRGKELDAKLHEEAETVMRKAPRAGVERFQEEYRKRWGELEEAVAPVCKAATGR